MRWLWIYLALGAAEAIFTQVGLPLIYRSGSRRFEEQIAAKPPKFRMGVAIGVLLHMITWPLSLGLWAFAMTPIGKRSMRRIAKYAGLKIDDDEEN
jgi:hypothetical protein